MEGSKVVLSGPVPVYANNSPKDPRVRFFNEMFDSGSELVIGESCQKVIHDLGEIVVAFPLTDAANRYVLERDLERIIAPVW